MNVKTTHVIQFILTLIIISAAAIANYYPTFAVPAMLVGTIAAGANLNLALLSGSIIDPTPMQTATQAISAATAALGNPSADPPAKG